MASDLAEAPVQEMEGEDVTLRDVMRFLRGNRRAILLCAILGSVVALLMAKSITETYRAEVKLAPVAEDGAIGGIGGGALGSIAEMAGVRVPGGDAVSATDAAIAIMKSRRFTEQFIVKENIAEVLKNRLNEGGASGLVTFLFGDLPESNDRHEELSRLYEYFDGLRTIAVDAKTGIVSLSVEWTDPLLAANWANKLVEHINRENREQDIEYSEKNLKYLQDAADATVNTERRTLLFQLIEAEIRKIMLAKSRDDYTFRVLSPAIAPREPSGPRVVLIVIAGFGLGAFGGIVFALYRNSRPLRQFPREGHQSVA